MKAFANCYAAKLYIIYGREWDTKKRCALFT